MNSVNTTVFGLRILAQVAERVDDESFAYTREFKKTGTFPYRCGPHPKMTGTVRVID